MGTLEVYNAGDDFALYINRLNHLLSLNKIKNDTDKISFLISLGGTELYKTMCSILPPKTEADFKYDDAVYLLKTRENFTKIFTKNWNFYKKSKFLQKIEIFAKNEILQKIDINWFLLGFDFYCVSKNNTYKIIIKPWLKNKNQT